MKEESVAQWLVNTKRDANEEEQKTKQEILIV
jgi:hypothetical protein